MKKNHLLLLLISISFLFSSCLQEKRLRLIGFTATGDSIIIKTAKNILHDFKSNEGCSGNICYFNKQINMWQGNQDLKLHILINSEEGKLLDTFVTIPEKNKKPFISFRRPSTTQSDSSRSVFVGDEGAQGFIVQ